MYRFNKYRKHWFNWRARAILNTSKVSCNPDSNVLLLSQTRDADLIMFLIAAKSFSRFIKPNGFVVVDDGLSAKNRRILEEHLEGIQFIPTHEIDVGDCPQGGTWERLVTISRLCINHYIVQLDSDTVTINNPAEVIECISMNRSFTLGTIQGRVCSPVQAISRLASDIESNHVQILAERALEALPDAENCRYVRGCSGFTGFHRGAITIEDLQQFSSFMEKQIGREKWREWGSEQVTSNYMIANTENPMVLPIEFYPYWKPGLDLENARLVHFIGTYRFEGKEYVKRAQAAIQALS